MRSLQRTSRHLDRTLSELQRSSAPPAPTPQAPPPKAKTDSRVRRRVQCALVVSENEVTRRVLVEMLIAAGFFVDWAGDAHGARLRAERSQPDVVIVEHSSSDGLIGEVVGGLTPADGSRRTIGVRVDLLAGSPPSERRVTIVSLRRAGQAAPDVVNAVAQAIGVLR